MKYLKFESFDKTVLQCYFWDNVKEPKGVVQIVHGMAEHARRYDDFANFLNKNGYICFADDHRAHGATETDENRGYHDGDIMADTVQDQIAITAYLKKTYNLPVIYFGHSYGSFLGQRYIQLNSAEIQGCVLCGTAKMSTLLTSVGSAVSKMCCVLCGPKKKGNLMDKLSFGSFNTKFKKDDPNFGWLSRDKEQVKKYVFDEQCGFVMSNSFYWSMTHMVSKVLYKKAELEKIRKDLPIAMFCGGNDPVNGGKGVDALKLQQLYDGLGIKDVELTLVEGGRHEILNEINNQEVYKNMLSAIDGFLK